MDKFKILQTSSNALFDATATASPNSGEGQFNIFYTDIQS